MCIHSYVARINIIIFTLCMQTLVCNDKGVIFITTEIVNTCLTFKGKRMCYYTEWHYLCSLSNIPWLLRWDGMGSPLMMFYDVNKSLRTICSRTHFFLPGIWFYPSCIEWFQLKSWSMTAPRIREESDKSQIGVLHSNPTWGEVKKAHFSW